MSKYDKLYHITKDKGDKHEVKFKLCNRSQRPFI